MAVRIIIADDYEPVRRAIRTMLARHEDWEVCGEAADGVEAIELARQLRPTVLVTIPISKKSVNPVQNKARSAESAL